MRLLPSPQELVEMTHAQIKRMAFTQEERQAMCPEQRAIISLKHTEELTRTKLKIHRAGGYISLRQRGKWTHHQWEISVKDFKKLSDRDRCRIERAGIAIVEAYSIG